MRRSALRLNMFRPRLLLLLLLLLLVLLDVSSGDLKDLVAQCSDFRRCSCAVDVSVDVSVEKLALASVNNRYIKKICTGVLTNNFYVLTSAECGAGVDKMNPAITVSFPNSGDLATSSIFLPTDYLPDNLPRISDIMLVRLKDEVDIKVNIPICLPQPSLIIYQGMNATIMAPGQRSVSVKIHGEVCLFRHQLMGPVKSIRVKEDLFMCAGEVNTDFCSAWPGSLLVREEYGWYTLLGISTTHDVFPMCSISMGLFSGVLLHREWIRSITTQQGASQCQFVN